MKTHLFHNIDKMQEYYETPLYSWGKAVIMLLFIALLAHLFF
jgi:hypothetical protein